MAVGSDLYTKTAPVATSNTGSTLEAGGSSKSGTKASTTSGNTSVGSNYRFKITLKKGAVVRADAKLSSNPKKEISKDKETFIVNEIKIDSNKNTWYYIEEYKGYVLYSDVADSEYQKSTVKINIETNKNKTSIIYKEPSTSSEVIKIVIKDADLIASKRVKDDKGQYWYYIPTYKGYIRVSDVEKATNKTTWTEYLSPEQKEAIETEKNNIQKRIDNAKNYRFDKLSKITDLTKWVNNSKSEEEKQAKIDRIAEYEEQKALDAWMDKYGLKESSLKKTSNSMLNSNTIGIFGCPYQFNEDTDEKVDGTIYGVTYADKILTKMPLMIVTPGEVSYMSTFKESEKILSLRKLLGLDPSDSNDANQEVSVAALTGTDVGGIMDSGRYFTFENTPKISRQYFDYVNSMCWSGAKFLGIENAPISVESKSEYKIGNYDWSKATKNTIKSYVMNKPAISFYVDSCVSADEDFSNSTTESQLASKINQFADIGREIQFIMGNATGTVPDWMKPTDLESTIADIEKISQDYKMNNRLLVDMAKNFATVATGGQLLFPEIWADSEYSKSFNINMKFRTPDADILSWYLNIYVPICHLVALTAPRQVVSSYSANGYMSPFLVRAYLKGMFNCDCGIVTSLNISRGREGSWTLDGLPTEVDISMTMKDLYSMIMLTKSTNAEWFMNNTALMDYIANNCGININEPDMYRQMTMYMQMKVGNVKTFPNRVFSTIGTTVENLLGKVYSKIGF